MARTEKLSFLGISAFTESMASMLEAGIENSEAISLLRQKEKNGGALDQGLQVMEGKLSEGASLSEAMIESGMFPDYALEMVKAGEATGKSEDVLKRLSSYYASQHSLKEKIRSTIVYPLAMIVLIIIVLFLMLKMVLPAFSNVYETLTGSLSQSSYSYIEYAYLFCRIALVVMVVLVLAVIAGFILYRCGFRKQVSSVLKLLPGAKNILENLALYRFTSAYEVYLSSGYMQDDALDKAMAMAEEESVVNKLKQVKAKMAEGHGFAMSANEASLYEPVYGRMLIAAEKSGTSEAALARLVDLLSENVKTTSDRLLNSLESLLSAVLMVTVAIALLCVMLPLIGIMNSIG